MHSSPPKTICPRRTAHVPGRSSWAWVVLLLLGGGLVLLGIRPVGSRAQTAPTVTTPDEISETGVVRLALRGGGGTQDRHRGADPGPQSPSGFPVPRAEGNDPLPVEATASDPTFTEGGGAVEMFSDASVGTVESGQQVESLDVEVSNLADGAAETLVIDGSEVVLTDGTSVTTANNSLSANVSVSGQTGTLTLSGGFSPGTAETILNALAYKNTSDAPSAGTGRTVTVTNAVDPDVPTPPEPSGSNPGTGDPSSTVTIQPINDGPTIQTNQTLSLDKGGSAGISRSLLEATDVEQGPSSLTYTIDADVTEGQLRNTDTGTQLDQGDAFTQADVNNGAVEYRHNGSATPSEGFDFTVSDGAGGSVSGTFSIAVRVDNDPPTVTLSPTSTSIDENNSGAVVVSTITIGDDGTGTNDLSLSGPDAGAFAIDGSDLSFTATADFETQESYAVTVEVDDPNVGTDPDDSEDFSLSVDDVNEPPTLETNQTLSLDEGASAPLSQRLLEATDPEQGPAHLTYTIDADVSEGRLYDTEAGAQLDAGDSFTQADLNEGSIEYRHDGSEPSGEGFDFTVSDGTGRTNSGTFSVAITQVNDAPTIETNAGLSIVEDSAAAITATELHATDPDDEPSALTYTVLT